MRSIEDYDPERLLSHRLRGFDGQESTRLGLERALIAGVRNCEFDVRFTRDGHPVAYHDPLFKANDGSWQYIDTWDFAALRTQEAFDQVATLEDMLACFVEFRRPRAVLHVDVKVGGHEEVIHDTIAKFGLIRDVVLVSWLPAVLLRFNVLSPLTRLCLSHFTLNQPLYGIAKRLSPLVNRIPDGLGQTLRNSGNQFFREASTVALYFHDNGDPASGDLSDDGAHHNLCHAVPGLLKGRMLDLLRRTGGMVCLPVIQATRSLRQSYQALNIQLAVYSVAVKQSLERVMREVEPDIVYIDNPDLFLGVSELQPHYELSRQR